MSRLLGLEELRKSKQAWLFEGDRHGDGLAASFFYVDIRPGGVVSLHLHPYPEVFLVQAGEAEFRAGEDNVRATAGQVLVIPAETPHGFTNTGDGQLRVVSVHPSGTVQQTNLEEG